jgi:hypothetical protein
MKLSSRGNDDSTCLSSGVNDARVDAAIFASALLHQPGLKKE